MKRREFLTLAAAASLPAILLPRRARAATRARGRVRHLLILYAKGGLRSHATFNAVGGRQHNPWGVQEAAPGTEWRLGAACAAGDISTPSGLIDGFAKRTHRVAVLACVDHDPSAKLPDVDHQTASNRIGTGHPDGTEGLLTLIGRTHPMFGSGFSPSAVPPVEIGTSELGLGGGDLSRFRPLSVTPPDEGFGEARVRTSWNVPARSGLDRRFLARKPAAFRPRVDGFLLAKKNAATFADLLRDPRLDLFGAPDAVDAGVANRELLDILGRDPLSSIGDPEESTPWGPRVALALRMFGFGSPAAAVTNDIYDLHDDERAAYGPRSTDLVRQLAGLDELLHRMPHPSGGAYWDHTLVAVVSEFSRNNTSAETGFNSGNGSDHVEERPGPCRNQAIAVMGGPVTAAGRLIGSTDAEMNATGTVFGSRRLLATFLDVLGLDNAFGDAPIEELFA